MSAWKTYTFRPLPPLEELQNRVTYDPETGILRHALNSPYARGHYTTIPPQGGVNVDGRGYGAARVIWKLMTGEDPPRLVDHEDGNRDNNRWSNLRDADWRGNAINRAYDPQINRIGVKGVVLNKRVGGRPFCAYVVRDGRLLSLGTYNRLEDAVAARRVGEIRHYGEFRTDRLLSGATP